MLIRAALSLPKIYRHTYQDLIDEEKSPELCQLIRILKYFSLQNASWHAPILGAYKKGPHRSGSRSKRYSLMT
ncbi:hypothetical protein Lepto7375DRAFT_4455 [Leptolyngbya sp. PCC 7375]|nr:hypothetical protein Lepto7375DRAFT_4455 [Leptolyngbya sp. PCC 7375]